MIIQMVLHKILIVEDEQDIQELLSYNLESEGYEVAIAGTGEEALAKVTQFQPDLVLLDLMLPGLGGMEICKRFKKAKTTRHIPIIMLTARGEEADIVLGLEAGAVDYVTKPFSPRVLLARIRALSRRDDSDDEDEGEVLTIGEITLNTSRVEVKVADEPVSLTATEFKLLTVFMEKPGRVFTRNQIIDRVMGQEYAVTERSVDVQVVGLRKKLGDAAACIETVRGIGYRFRDQ